MMALSLRIDHSNVSRDTAHVEGGDILGLAWGRKADAPAFQGTKARQ
jgi:hypothetical protein